jgi:hypothetical protein
MRSVFFVAQATWLTCSACAGLAVGCGSSRPSGASDASTPLTGLEAGTPYLTELAVSASSALTLVPSFSPTVYDYYVVCAAGTNALSVSMTASSGAESAILAPTKSTSRSEQTVSVDVDENQAIVAVATHGTKAQEYWVRCLPHDFPKLQLQPHPDAGNPTPGYYLIGNMTVPTGEGGYAMVMDGNGVPVWYYREPNGVGVYNVESIVSGTISFIPSPRVNPYEVHRLSPLETTYVLSEGAATDEHELQALPNGDYLTLRSATQTGIDLTGLTLPLANGGTQSFGPNGSIVGCGIQEVDASGNLVWQWEATDHFDSVKDISYLSPALIEGGVSVVEPFHCNSIEVDASGNLLVSSRNMDSIFYIEKSTSKVLWKMGGKTYTKDGATYVPVADPFYRQHDARFPNGWTSTCSGGSGQVTVFDDETSEPGPARGVVYDVTVAGRNDGTAACKSLGDGGTSGATVAWQYQGPSSIPATGSFRVLADGSHTIGWGTSGGFIFTEADAKGNDLLDLYFADGSSSYRAIKVPLTAFDLNVLRTTVGVTPTVGSSDAGAMDGGRDGNAGIDAGAGDAASTDGGAGDSGDDGSGG